MMRQSHNHKGDGYNMWLICLDLCNKGIQIGYDLEIVCVPLTKASSSAEGDDVSRGPQMALAILSLQGLSVLVINVWS